MIIIILKMNCSLLSTILVFVCSFIRVLKYYCRDKTALHHANVNNHYINSVSTNPTQIWSFVPLPDSFSHNFAKIRVLMLSYFPNRLNFRRISLVFKNIEQESIINLTLFSFSDVNFIEIKMNHFKLHWKWFYLTPYLLL